MKLTKAQLAFLKQLRCFRPGHGFEQHILRGSETAMARRLQAQGLVGLEFHMGIGERWVITQAGRTALANEEDR